MFNSRSAKKLCAAEQYPREKPGWVAVLKTKKILGDAVIVKQKVNTKSLPELFITVFIELN